MWLRHIILFLTGHQQSLLILLFQEHQLHLIVLKGMVASLVRAGGNHSPTIDGVEVVAVHGRTWHLAALL